jgi:NADH-quinone oxidoreductase subunit I
MRAKMSARSIIKFTVDAFKVVIRNFIKPERITIYYPYERLEYGAVRGWIGLHVEKCTSCMMCARVCPANAIKMYLAPDGKRRPGIDYGRCIMCHFCIDTCPADALYSTEIKDLAFYSYDSMVFTPDREKEPPRVEELRKPVEVIVDYVRGTPRKLKVARS